MTTGLPDYNYAIERCSSIALDVTRTIFIGPSAAGKSSIKHLLVNDESKVINASMPVLDTPAIVSLSSEQFAAKEASSLWKAVLDESMAASIKIACSSHEYHSVPRCGAMLIHESRSLLKPRGSKIETSATNSKKGRNPVSHPHGQPVLPTQEEVLPLRLELEQAHKALLDNLGTGIEEQLPKTAQFVHLLDCGGQPTFQDALPLLLQIPRTYVLVFDASQDLNSLSSVYTLAKKCSSSIAKFQEKGGCLPQFRILLVGTFKDCLIREGRLQEAITTIKQHIKLLEKKPYYKRIARDSMGQPLFLINNRVYLDTFGNVKEEQACVGNLYQLLSDPAAILKLQVPPGWFQFELVTCQVETFFKVSEIQQSVLQLKSVSREKELHDLHFLGFSSDIVCTDNIAFLKEVSKLLAVQYLRLPKTQTVEAFKYKGILSLDEHLFDELDLSKELVQCLAVELAANRGWKVTPEQSTRLAIKFQWQERIIIIEESVGFISAVPIVSDHVACDAGKLHDVCRMVISTMKEAVCKSGQAVFGNQFTDRANVDLGFQCLCEIQSPHLAIPIASRGSIVCLMSQTHQEYLQTHQIWFSCPTGAEVSLHVSVLCSHAWWRGVHTKSIYIYQYNVQLKCSNPRADCC